MRHPGVPPKKKMGSREMNSKMVVVMVGPSFRFRTVRFKSCDSKVALMMRCAKGVSLRGFGDVRGFPFCGGKKETPSCGGEKGLRLPLSLGRSMRNKGVPDPFFPPQKGKPRTSPNPLSKNPLSATHHLIGFGKGGLLEKGSFQKNPFSRAFRDFRDSGEWPPLASNVRCGKQCPFRKGARLLPR